MIALRTLKSLLGMFTGGAVVAAMVALVGIALLVLFVIPGGLGILTIEYDRLQRWLRRALGLPRRLHPEANHESRL